MKSGWQICEERRAKPKRPPRVYVSLNRRGEIAMNAAAFSLIKKPASVTLMFDEAGRRIGVKYPVPKDRNFFKVRKYGRDGKMSVVRAGRVLKERGVEIERLIVFKEPKIELINGDPMIVLELERREER